MLTALTANSNEEYVQYLVSKCDEVEHDLALKIASAQDPYEREAAGDLTRRPYLRWLAALASRAFISGRYRMSLEAANRSLDFAPNDPAASAILRCLPWQSSNTLPRSSNAFALPTPCPILPNTPLRRRPKDAEPRTWTVDAHRADERCLARAGLRGCRALLAHPCTLVPTRSRGALLPNRVSRWRLCPRQRGCGLHRRACPCAIRATPVLQEAWAPPTTPALPPGSPPTISCVPRSTSASCGRPSRACRLREETSNGSERLHPRLPGARLRCVAPRTHRCSTRACP